MKIINIYEFRTNGRLIEGGGGDLYGMKRIWVYRIYRAPPAHQVHESKSLTTVVKQDAVVKQDTVVKMKTYEILSWSARSPEPTDDAPLESKK